MAKPHAQEQFQGDSWATRLKHAEAALLRSPDSAQAWHWRIQIKVLRFLVARYSSEALLDSKSEKRARSPERIDLVLPQNPKPPLPTVVRKRLLKHIRNVNDAKPKEPCASEVVVPPAIVSYLASRLATLDQAPLPEKEWRNFRWLQIRLQSWQRGFAVLERHFPAFAQCLVTVLICLWFGICFHLISLVLSSPQ